MVAGDHDVTGDVGRIDDMLAMVLRGEPCAWPAAAIDPDEVLVRILYHGVAGLIANRARDLVDWPAALLDKLREQGIALAMWELRHKAVLGDLLAALADAKVAALLLKGTALAYDLYLVPATRARGDSDLLIAPADLAAARAVFTRLGYRHQPLDAGIADDLALQEVWTFGCAAGTVHHIDLHWQLINAPALAGVLDIAGCMAGPHPLPRLGPNARAMSRPLTLLHSCIHRAMHLTSPYRVDGLTYYGGDRLIWANDIALLAEALSDAEWRQFTAAAIDQGVATVCRNGLDLALRRLASPIPDDVMASLRPAHAEPVSAYLLDFGQARRAWLDMRSIRGWRRKLAYVAARGLPGAAFMRGKYPALAHRPLILLHARRMIELVRPRPGGGQRG